MIPEEVSGVINFMFYWGSMLLDPPGHASYTTCYDFLPLRKIIYSFLNITLHLDHILMPSDLSKILSALWEARSRWYNLGLELKLPPGTLEAIKLENPHVSGDCFRAMLYEWLKKLDPPPTWQSLSKALLSPTVEMGELVKEFPYGL